MSMIVNGGGRGNVGFWSGHLIDQNKNDRAEVKEIRGVLAEDLPGALREMALVASGTRSQGNFMYVADINPTEKLTEKQWQEAIDLLEEKLGMVGHPRVVVEHEKDGRVHRHIVWTRVTDDMKIVDVRGDYYTHERVARALETRFDLTPGPSRHGMQHDGPRPDRAPDIQDHRIAEKAGTTPEARKAAITEARNKAVSPERFKEAVNELGYLLARGDSCRYVLVDRNGAPLNVVTAIKGGKAKDINPWLDAIGDKLPSFAEAKQVQQHMYAADPAERTLTPKQITAERKTAMTDAWNQSDSARSTASAIAEAGYILAIGDDRAFVVVDRAGFPHSLPRQIQGVNTKQVRDRLGVLIENLPSADEAKEIQRQARETIQAERKPEPLKAEPLAVKLVEHEIEKLPEIRPEIVTPEKPVRAELKAEPEIEIEAHKIYEVEPEEPIRPEAKTEPEHRQMTASEALEKLQAHQVKSAELKPEPAHQPVSSPALEVPKPDPAQPTEVVRSDINGELAADQVPPSVEKVEQQREGNRPAPVLSQFAAEDIRAPSPPSQPSADIKAPDIDLSRQPVAAEPAASQVEPAPEARAPGLNKTAAEIRLAWSLTESADAFASRLEERGFTLAQVSADEAHASHRVAELAKAVGNYSPRYAEGEIVVVNNFGNVYHLNERVTGESPEEVQKYLGSLDAKALLNMGDAQAAMKEVARHAFYEQKEEARPLTKMESHIQDLQEAAKTAGAFGAALFRDGITIAHVDPKGLEDLAFDHRTNSQEYKLAYIGALKPDDLVAVDSRGSVYRLNPHKLDVAGIELALSGGQKTIPTLGSARENIVRDWSIQQTANAERRREFSDAVNESVAAKNYDWNIKRDIDATLNPKKPMQGEPSVAAVAAVPVNVGFKVLDKATGIITGLLDFLSGTPDPPPPRGEMERIQRMHAAVAALESVCEAASKGEALKAEDLRHLTPQHRENIRLRGDDAVRELLKEADYYQQQERSQGRER